MMRHSSDNGQRVTRYTDRHRLRHHMRDISAFERRFQCRMYSWLRHLTKKLAALRNVADTTSGVRTAMAADTSRVRQCVRHCIRPIPFSLATATLSNRCCIWASRCLPFAFFTVRPKINSQLDLKMGSTVVGT